MLECDECDSLVYNGVSQTFSSGGLVVSGIRTAELTHSPGA